MDKIYTRLTNLEKKILELMVFGKNEADMSNLLNIEIKTIKSKKAVILKKLNAKSEIRAAIIAIKENLI